MGYIKFAVVNVTLQSEKRWRTNWNVPVANPAVALIVKMQSVILEFQKSRIVQNQKVILDVRLEITWWLLI